MFRLRWGLLGLCALLIAQGLAAAGPPENARDAQALADKIDTHLRAKQEAEKATVAPLADDSEFLRRTCLDIGGKIPPVSRVRRFLNEQSSDKRKQLVDELLDGPGYVSNMTNLWASLLMPEADTDFQLSFIRPGFQLWLRQQFADNVGYDKMVRALLTAPLGDNQNFRNIYQSGGQASPVAFYMAKESKPENLAASTARLFLGVRLECAQCHNHPFAQWKREQFWGLAAFFAGLQRQGEFIGAPTRELIDRREIAIVGTDKVVQASFLDGSEPQWKYKVGPRVTLADWITAKDNPFFARATVNRVWAHFFGIGLVDPVDDFGDEHKPSHPALLDELARDFVAHDFDLKYLIRAICYSKSYQMTSAAADPGREESRLFTRMAVKGLTGEQLFDSLAQASGYRDLSPSGPQFFGQNTPRTQFLAKFAAQEKRTEYQTSIPQALSLMNGQLVSQMTSADRSETLSSVAEAPFMDTPAKVETLFLAALGRKPKPTELEHFVKYVESGGPKKNNKAALADVFWALLNSSEFLFNH